MSDSTPAKRRRTSRLIADPRKLGFRRILPSRNCRRPSPHATASPRDFCLTVCRSAVATTATMAAAASKEVPHAVTIRVTLYAGQPYLDVEWQVAGKRPDPWPEAGWLCFPLRTSPAFRLGRLGSIVDPAENICRSANFEIFCLNTGLNVLGSGGPGAGLCPIDSPLVSLGRPGLYRWSRTFEPRKPVVLVNLFNNLFGTNFQQWIGGSWSSRVRLWPAGGANIESDLITPAWEARSPLLAAATAGPAGPLPPMQAGIELSRKGTLVTAWGRTPTATAPCCGFGSSRANRGRAGFTCPNRSAQEAVQPCDLRGRPQGPPLALRDGSFGISLTPFSPLSFLIREVTGK